LQAWRKMIGPSPSKCSLSRRPGPALRSNLVSFALRVSRGSRRRSLLSRFAGIFVRTYQCKPAAEAADPHVLAWMNCTTRAALRYLDGNETADVIARASMTSCSQQEAAVQEALPYKDRSPRAVHQIMEIRRKMVRERLVEIIVRNRQELSAAVTHYKAWNECLVNTATSLATSRQATEDSVKATFHFCRDREHSARTQLNSVIGSNLLIESAKRTWVLS
jgi:hypothetical protein